MRNNLIIETAHQMLSNYITQQDIIVDATMGNGNDTVFLAKKAKFVYAFDIQQQAIDQTKLALDSLNISNAKLILDSHEHINQYVPEFKGVVFNLGYLPKGDKSITTTSDITIKTITSLLPKLKLDGFILLVVYIGHKAGMDESLSIESYLQTLDQSVYKILKINLPYQDNKPPYILFLQKVKDESI